MGGARHDVESDPGAPIAATTNGYANSMPSSTITRIAAFCCPVTRIIRPVVAQSPERWSVPATTLPVPKTRGPTRLYTRPVRRC